jgi:methylase of polypeptide subunit release factors
VEVGYNQAEAVREIFERQGLGNIVIHRDFAEIKRVVSAIQP